MTDAAAIVQAINGEWNDQQVPWEDLWMIVAHLMAKRSRCSRDRVGAILASRDNVLLAGGYNGASPNNQGEGWCSGWCQRAVAHPPGEPAGASYDDCDAVHAEVNCLLRAPEYPGRSVLYVSTVPCVSCAKFIAACVRTKGVTEVVAARGGVGDGYRDTARAIDILVGAGVSFRTWRPTNQSPLMVRSTR